MIANGNDRQWYVLHTKSRFENVVNDGLNKKTIEVFLPKIKVRSKRRDRKLMINVPLFPGYVFVKSDLHPDNHLEIVKDGRHMVLIKELAQFPGEKELSVGKDHTKYQDNQQA